MFSKKSPPSPSPHAPPKLTNFRVKVEIVTGARGFLLISRSADFLVQYWINFERNVTGTTLKYMNSKKQSLRDGGTVTLWGKSIKMPKVWWLSVPSKNPDRGIWSAYFFRNFTRKNFVPPPPPGVCRVMCVGLFYWTSSWGHGSRGLLIKGLLTWGFRPIHTLPP